MSAIPLAIHVLTCLGGVCALQAVLAFVSLSPEAGFAWLGLALIIDGVDGPLARHFDVRETSPHIHGDVLDLVVDFLSYVFAPVVALIAGGVLVGVVGQMLAASILVSSLLYFADDRMKDAENRFVGFPTLWNVVAFYLLALEARQALAAAIVIACIVMTFVPLKWIHPVRVRDFRAATLSVTALWAWACCAVLWTGFPGPVWARTLLVVVLAYWLGLTLLWRLKER